MMKSAKTQSQNVYRVQNTHGLRFKRKLSILSEHLTVDNGVSSSTSSIETDSEAENVRAS